MAMASFPVAERCRCPFDSLGQWAASKGAHTNTGGLGGRAVGQTVLLTIFSATMFFFFAASVDISRGTLTTPHTNAHTQTMRRKHKRQTATTTNFTTLMQHKHTNNKHMEFVPEYNNISAAALPAVAVLPCRYRRFDYTSFSKIGFYVVSFFVVAFCCLW